MKKSFLRLLLPAITLSGALMTGEARTAPVPGDQSIVKVHCTLSGTVEKANVSCSGNDGQITVINPDGADAFEFSIDGNNWQDSPDFTGLLPNSYEVWMRNKADIACTRLLGNISLIAYPPLDASISSENINCTPNHQGKIDFTTIQGGSGNYEFSADGGTTWQSTASITIQHAGSYTPVLRDAVHPHCEKTFPAVTITAPAILSATATHQDAACYGTNSGTITIHSSGGTNAFQYSIDGGASWQGPGNITYTYSNVAKGTYNVQVRDNAINNCILILNSNLEVGEAEQLNADITATDVIDCYGQPAGSIAFTNPSGGSGNYEYSINNRISWQSTPVFNNLPSQNYRVFIRDANVPSCYRELPNVFIDQKQQLSAALSSKVNSCFGLEEGEIEFVSESGGSGNYLYSIDNGATWQANSLFTGLKADSYQVLLADADHPTCIEEIDNALIITEPNDLDAEVEYGDATCYNTANGYINILNPSGRSSSNSYMYSIDNGNTWSPSRNFTGLASGQTYTVLIRDAITSTCRKTLGTPITLTQPAQLTASASGTDADCFGASTGTITFSGISGGSGTYEFSINDGTTWEADPLFDAVAAGNHALWIRDAEYPTCQRQIHSAFAIGQPPKMQAIISNTNVNCYGDATGYIEFTNPSGGSGSYSYSIDGGQQWQINGQFGNLPAGKYNVMVKDNHCEASLDTALHITQPARLDVQISKQDVLCFGNTDGSITFSNPSGGSGTYQYSRDNGQSWQSPNDGSSRTYSNLAPGTYNLWIRDATTLACSLKVEDAYPITQPDKLAVTTVLSEKISCAGADDGSIQFSGLHGGSGNYEFSIDGSNTWSDDSVFTDLAPDTYILVVRDAVAPSCILYMPDVILSAPAPLSAGIDKDTITCFEADNGAIRFVNMYGGWGSYEFSIDNGTSWTEQTGFTNLPPATYTALIRDKNYPSCTLTIESVSFAEPPRPDAQIDFDTISCFGAADGRIEFINLSSSTIDYEFSVDNGTTWQTSPVFSNLGQGIYTPQIRHAGDDLCKTTLDAVEITEPAELTATASIEPVTCYSGSNGSITIHALNGSGVYQYSIDNGATWSAFNTFNNLTADTYDLQIRDMANPGCSKSLGPITISQPAQIVLSTSKTDVDCHDASTGSVNITISGGTSPFEYSVNGGAWTPDADLNNIPAGTYVILAREINQPACISDPVSVFIEEPADILYSVTTEDIICNSESTGKINLETDPVDPRTFSFSIDGGNTWQSDGNFENLHAGTYSILIQDVAVNTCTKTVSVSVYQPAPLDATITSSDITCSGTDNGSIILRNLSGGSGTFEISIDNGLTWSDDSSFYNLAAGTYDVILKDAQVLCYTSPENIVIKNVDPITALATPEDVTCYDAADGQVSIAASGGSGVYEYSLDGTIWTSNATITNLKADTYQVIVRDANDNSCSETTNGIVINEPAPLSFTTSLDDPDCLNASNGEITIQVSGGTGPFEYSADNGMSWSSFNVLSGLQAGTYSVLIREANNTSCVSPAQSVTLTEPQDFAVSSILTHISCHGEYSGAITLVQEHTDNRTYEYSIDNGGSWNLSGNFENLGIGTYTVLIRDEANPSCSKSFEYEIIRNNTLSAVVSSANILCSGRNDGSIRFDDLSGGSGDYEFSIDGNNWQSGPEFTGLATGTYTALIRDVADPLCIETLTTVTITEPDPISAIITGTNIDCANEHNGSITISATGGSGLYEYSVDNINWTDISPISNLSVGTYTVIVRDQADNSCLYNAGSVTITSPSPITATLSSTDINCSGALRGNIILSEVEGGSGNYEYSFDNQQTWIGTQAVSDLDAGTYTVFIRDADAPACIVEIGEAIVNDYELHTDGVQIIGASCFGGSDASLEVLNPRGGETTNYEFSTNGFTWQTSPVFTDLYANEYNLYIRNSDATQCSKSLGKVEVEETEILSAIALGDENLCMDSHSIYIEEISGGSGVYEFSIDGQSWKQDTSFTELSNGTYLVMMRDANAQSCSVVLNSGISFEQPPVPFAYINTRPSTGCIGNTNGEIMVLGDGGRGSYQFAISDGGSWSEFTTYAYNNTEPHTFSNISTGSYFIKIKDPFGCETTLDETAVVSHTDPGYSATITEELAEELNFCITEFSVRFGVQAENAETYQWLVNGSAISNGGIYSGSNSRELVINPFTPDLDGNIYSVVVTGACDPADTSSGKLVVSELISPLISDAQTTCPEGDLSEIVLRGYGQAAILQWEMKTPEATDWSLVPESAYRDSIYPVHAQGEYLYRAYVQNGACAPVYSPSSSYTMLPAPAASAGDNIELTKGKSVTLNANGGVLYEWNWDITLSDSSIANPVVNPEYTTTYYVKITNEYGCSKYDSVLVEVVEDHELYIPNTFTPNNDGTNDTWAIRSIEQYPDASLEIYNRWGMLLYRQTNGVKPWNGTASGKELPTGTYFYVLKLTPDSESLSGSVSIVR